MPSASYSKFLLIDPQNEKARSRLTRFTYLLVIITSSASVFNLGPEVLQGLLYAIVVLLLLWKINLDEAAMHIELKAYQKQIADLQQQLQTLEGKEDLPATDASMQARNDAANLANDSAPETTDDSTDQQ